MTRYSREEAARKADRALKMHEQGLTHAVIAERLSCSPSHVGACCSGHSNGGTG